MVVAQAELALPDTKETGASCEAPTWATIILDALSPNIIYIMLPCVSVRNANSGCGFCRSEKTIALSVKGKNKLYGITVYLLLGLECTSQFGMSSLR